MDIRVLFILNGNCREWDVNLSLILLYYIEVINLWSLVPTCQVSRRGELKRTWIHPF